MQRKFNVGDTVRWTSQSQSYQRTRTGTVKYVIPPHTAVWRVIEIHELRYLFDCKNSFDGTARSTESYLVATEPKLPGRKERLYWPRTNYLESV